MEVSKDSDDSLSRSFERVKREAEAFRSFDKSKKKKKQLRSNQRLVNFLSSSKYSKLVQEQKYLSESRILEELENYDSEDDDTVPRKTNRSMTNVAINIAQPQSYGLL